MWFDVLLYRVWMVFVFPRLGPVHIFDFNSSLPRQIQLVQPISTPPLLFTFLHSDGDKQFI